MKLTGLKLLQVALILVLAGLAACGGDDDDDDGRNPPATVELFSSALSGAQETPPPNPAVTGTGTGAVTYTPSTRRLQALVRTTGVAGTVAHIHQGAVGVAGPIIFPLTETVAGSGVWSTDIFISEAQEALLRSGNYYFNVHSTVNPSGEIRGQILADVTLFSTALTGAQETPPNQSLATGTGTVTFAPSTRRLQAVVRTSGVIGTAAHIHQGAAGVAGPIIFPLTEAVAGSGVWSTDIVITEEQAALLRSGIYYFNVHSTQFPGGEIRGQILAPAGISSSALRAAQKVAFAGVGYAAQSEPNPYICTSRPAG